MTATVIERQNVAPGEDRFAVVESTGEVLTSHPTRRGAHTLATRWNLTGSLEQQIKRFSSQAEAFDWLKAKGLKPSGFGIWSDGKGVTTSVTVGAGNDWIAGL